MGQVVQRLDTGQVHQPGFVEAYLDRAFIVGTVGTRQFPGMNRRRRHRLKQSALATVGHAHQGNA